MRGGTDKLGRQTQLFAQALCTLANPTVDTRGFRRGDGRRATDGNARGDRI